MASAASSGAIRATAAAAKSIAASVAESWAAQATRMLPKATTAASIMGWQTQHATPARTQYTGINSRLLMPEPAHSTPPHQQYRGFHTAFSKKAEHSTITLMAGQLLKTAAAAAAARTGSQEATLASSVIGTTCKPAMTAARESAGADTSSTQLSGTLVTERNLTAPLSEQDLLEHKKQLEAQGLKVYIIDLCGAGSYTGNEGKNWGMKPFALVADVPRTLVSDELKLPTTAEQADGLTSRILGSNVMMIAVNPNNGELLTTYQCCQHSVGTSLYQMPATTPGGKSNLLYIPGSRSGFGTAERAVVESINGEMHLIIKGALSKDGNADIAVQALADTLLGDPTILDVDTSAIMNAELFMINRHSSGKSNSDPNRHYYILRDKANPDIMVSMLPDWFREFGLNLTTYPTFTCSYNIAISIETDQYEYNGAIINTNYPNQSLMINLVGPNFHDIGAIQMNRRDAGLSDMPADTSNWVEQLQHMFSRSYSPLLLPPREMLRTPGFTAFQFAPDKKLKQLVGASTSDFSRVVSEQDWSLWHEARSNAQAMSVYDSAVLPKQSQQVDLVGKVAASGQTTALKVFDTQSRRKCAHTSIAYARATTRQLADDALRAGMLKNMILQDPIAASILCEVLLRNVIGLTGIYHSKRPDRFKDDGRAHAFNLNGDWTTHSIDHTHLEKVLRASNDPAYAQSVLCYFLDDIEHSMHSNSGLKRRLHRSFTEVIKAIANLEGDFEKAIEKLNETKDSRFSKLELQLVCSSLLKLIKNRHGSQEAISYDLAGESDYLVDTPEAETTHHELGASGAGAGAGASASVPQAAQARTAALVKATAMHPQAAAALSIWHATQSESDTASPEATVDASNKSLPH